MIFNIDKKSELNGIKLSVYLASPPLVTITLGWDSSKGISGNRISQETEQAGAELGQLQHKKLVGQVRKSLYFA